MVGATVRAMVRRGVDRVAAERAVARVRDWLLSDSGDQVAVPSSECIAAAVRLSAADVAARIPGASVEVRIPPYVAVQCVAGVEHRRGTPPHVVECAPRLWLQLVAGVKTFAEVGHDPGIRLSGHRAGEVFDVMPLY